jgi:hypothetical protein
LTGCKYRALLPSLCIQNVSNYVTGCFFIAIFMLDISVVECSSL